MREAGGFEHNLQSLRVVDELEQRYAAFDGLNLCFETREGILKHCAPARAHALGELGLRFLSGRQPSMEAQLANLADEIAYNNHDIDDGLRSGLITLEGIETVELFARRCQAVRAAWPVLDERRLVYETVRGMIDELVADLLAETRRRLTQYAPDSIEAVRNAPPLVGFSEPMRAATRQLKAFLMSQLYRHPQVVARMEHAKTVVRDLFAAFQAQPALMPAQHAARHDLLGARATADYIAGMTDRYALKEHARLFGPSP
jgi:dGTPase